MKRGGYNSLDSYLHVDGKRRERKKYIWIFACVAMRFKARVFGKDGIGGGGRGVITRGSVNMTAVREKCEDFPCIYKSFSSQPGRFKRICRLLKGLIWGVGPAAHGRERETEAALLGGRGGQYPAVDLAGRESVMRVQGGGMNYNFQ